MIDPSGRLIRPRLRVCAGPRCGNLTWTEFCCTTCELDAKDDLLLSILAWGWKLGLWVLIPSLTGLLIVIHVGRRLGWWG